MSPLLAMSLRPSDEYAKVHQKIGFLPRLILPSSDHTDIDLAYIVDSLKELFWAQ